MLPDLSHRKVDDRTTAKRVMSRIGWTIFVIVFAVSSTGLWYLIVDYSFSERIYTCPPGYTYEYSSGGFMSPDQHLCVSEDGRKAIEADSRIATVND